MRQFGLWLGNIQGNLQGMLYDFLNVAGIYILKKIRNYTKTKVQNGETLPKLNIGIYSKFDQYYTRYNIIMYDFILSYNFYSLFGAEFPKWCRKMRLFSLFFWNVARAALLFKSPVVVLPISICWSFVHTLQQRTMKETSHTSRNFSKLRNCYVSTIVCLFQGYNYFLRSATKSFFVWI